MIAICTPIRDRVKADFMRSLLNADIPRPYEMLDTIGHSVEDARNLITGQALAIPEITHLMWIDDDATFDRCAIKHLVEHGMFIVGGLAFGRRPPYPPILLHENPNTAIKFDYQYDYPEGLIEVDATGGHFLLVRREVFEAIHKRLKPGEGPWTQRGLGEDVSFCQRARECGYRVMVDTSIKIGHIGEVNVDERFAKRNRDVLLNPWVK